MEGSCDAAVVECGRSAADMVGWTSGFDWGRVDVRIRVLGRWASWRTNGSVRRPGKPASYNFPIKLGLQGYPKPSTSHIYRFMVKD